MRSTLGTALLALLASFPVPGFAAVEGPEGADRPQLFPRSTYVWPYAEGPVYAEVEPSRWSEAGVLHTLVGSFDLKRGSPTLPNELRASEGSLYVILEVDPASP